MSIFAYTIGDSHLYEELRELLARGDLVVLAGAGLSRQAATSNGLHAPLWSELLTRMARWCATNRYIDLSAERDILKCIDDGYLIDAGEELRESLQELPRIQRCLKECVLNNELRGSEAHKLLVRVGWRAFLTTNYDDLIENQYVIERGLSLQKFVERTIEGVLPAYRQKTPFILKMHGDLTDPESIVLGTRAYDRLLYRNNNYRACVESIFTLSSVLFLGFGASDPNLETIMARVAGFDGRDQRQWMLLPDGKVPTLKIKRFVKDRGIKIIEYPVDAAHSGVVSFLKQLARVPVVEPQQFELDIASIGRKELNAVSLGR